MAVESLLQSKVQIPQIRAKLVSRPRLIRRLDAARDTRLTLVSAPAGSGKSTLLSQWAHQQPAPVAWLSLDERDNQLARFLSYLVAALQQVDPSIANDVRDHRPMAAFGDGSAQLPSWAEAALHTLLNDLTRLPGQIVLVLDDYQVIRHPAVHATMALLVEYLPAQVHLIILTRSNPPFSVVQLRGRGQITELRQSDLQFTLEESGEFLCQHMGLDLTEQQVGTLAERTEGWIAGLQMTAASLRHRAGPALSGFIADFTESNRFIFDYLLEEVLHQQPAAIQAFLIRTAILDRFSGPLCNYVMSTSDEDCQPARPAQHILEQLERSNLFLVPLDDNHQWYRYHHLFSALLRHRLQVLHPELVPELHCRASAWYQENGLIFQAMHHALAAGQDHLAAHLVEQAAEETLQQGQVTRFLGWLDALPPPALDRHPRLRVYQIGLQLFTGQAQEVVESGLQAVLDGYAPGEMVGEVAAFRALTAACQGDRSHSQALARMAVKHLPPESVFLRGLVAGLLGVCDLVREERAVEALSLSSLLRPVAERAGWTALILELLVLEALSHRALGHARRALEVLGEALQLAEPEGHARVFATAGAPMAELLQQEQSLGVFPDQVSGLVAALQAQHNIAETARESAADPLSQRELQVLQLIAQGLTNQQIADRLVIALSTVKSHINHIYRKLDVARRTEALLQARTLSVI